MLNCTHATLKLSAGLPHTPEHELIFIVWMIQTPRSCDEQKQLHACTSAKGRAHAYNSPASAASPGTTPPPPSILLQSRSKHSCPPSSVTSLQYYLQKSNLQSNNSSCDNSTRGHNHHSLLRHNATRGSSRLIIHSHGTWTVCRVTRVLTWENCG